MNLIKVVLWLSEQQAKVRDAERIASLHWLDAVLMTYFSDEWMFPKLDSNGCISDSEWKVSNEGVSFMLKWKVAPLDPKKLHLNGLC